MTTSRAARLRKAGASSLVALVAASALLVLDAAPAGAAAPVVVNAGVSAGPQNVPNWLESHAIERDDTDADGISSDAIFGTLVVRHDVGTSVTGLVIDSNWDNGDSTGSGGGTLGGVTVTTIPGGSTDHSTLRFSYVPPNHPNMRGTGIGCQLSGDSRPSGPQRVAVVFSDGQRTPAVTATVNQLLEGNCSVPSEYPTIFGQSGTTAVNPGGVGAFTFKGDDADGSGADDQFDKYRWRVRRLNDGVIVQGPTCVDIPGGGSDNVQQTLNVTFNNGRGRYVVEAEAGTEDDSCGDFVSGSRWWRLGAVDVNTAQATSPTLSLAGAPALVQAGGSYTVTATTGDAPDTGGGGLVQVIDWDAEGVAGFERRELNSPAAGVADGDLSQPVTTTVGQCADRTVSARVTDNGAMSASDPSSRQRSVSAVTEVNCAPVANNQTVPLNEDVTTNFTIAPSDGDSNPLTYSVTNAPDHGVLTGTFPGTFTYDPDDHFNGTDSYTYQVDDGRGGVDTAVVTFAVSPVNDLPVAQDVAEDTDEDTAIVLDLAPHISDPDEGDTPPQALTVSVLTQPAPGTGVATVTGPNQITYTPNPPANFNGVASFTYRVTDNAPGPDGTDDGTITITIDPIDDAPVAADQAVTTAEDTDKAVILGPSSDVDGEDVTYDVPLLLQPANGTVTVVGTTATYDPDDDFFGTDSFMFQATDGNSTTTGTVTVTVTPVNDAPEAESQSVSTPEDQDLLITLEADDVDDILADLTFEVVGGPSHGTLDTTVGDTLVYDPDDDYFGPDSLTFKVTDPDGATSTASVSIDVTPVNDAPVADDQSVGTDEDQAFAVLLTASDIDNPQGDLEFTIVDDPDSGTLSGSGANLVYWPNLNFVDQDSFTFQVADGAGGTNEGVVTIDVSPVNDPPTAIPQSLSTPEDDDLGITLTASDPDDDPSDLVFEITGDASNGTFDTLTGPNVTYTPDADFNGYDTFVFRVTDPDGQSDLATVVIAVGETGTNDLPVAEDDTVTTLEDEAAGVVLEASDVDGDELTYSIEVAPLHGVAAILNGVVIYEPNLNYHGTDELLFRVEDGQGGVAFGEIDFVVTSVNDLPEAIPATVVTNEDTAAEITLEGDDVESATLAFAVASGPSHGTLTGTAPELVYTPDTDYIGNDAFDFTVEDGDGAVTTGTISIVVQEVPKLITVMTAHPVLVQILTGGDLARVRIPASARLTDAAGNPLPGRSVVFTSGPMLLCTAVTDSTGRAACSGLAPLLQEILNLGYTAYYPGTADETASSDTAKLLTLLGLGIL